MMAMGMVEVLFFPLIWMLTMGAGGGLPLGVPPLPEDPALSQVAPERCLWYLSWSGTATPDPASTNHTEQLLAEPELQRLLKRIESSIQKAVDREVADSREESEALRRMPFLIKTWLTRPTAIFVEDIQFDARDPSIRAGMIVNAGKHSEEVEETLKQIEQLVAEGEPIKTFQEQGVTWRRMPFIGDAPEIAWARQQDYILFAMGDGSAAGILQRLKTPGPKWLSDLRDELAVDRVSLVSHFDLARVFAMLQQQRDGAEIRRILEAIGVFNISALQNVSGLDATGTVSRTRLKVNGKPQGLLSLLDAEPLSEKELSEIPMDALVAVAVRADPAEAFRTVVDVARQVDPGLGLEQEIGRAEESLGINFLRDLLQPLGDVWTIHNSPSDGLLTGVTATVRVDDTLRLRATQTKLVALARAMQLVQRRHRQRGDEVTVRDFEYRGHTIYFLNFVAASSPVAPAWCLVEDRLIVGLYPQAVKAHLARGRGDESLADRSSVRNALPQRPTVLAYQDSAKIFTLMYPMMQVAAQYLCSEIQEEGFDIDISALPTSRSITRHLQPAVMALSRTEAGFEVVQRQTLPMMGGLGASLPVLSATILGSTRLVRFETPQSAATSHMRQIAISMLQHEAQNNQLPAAFNVDEDGKPLLSWRVHLLPYLEQQPLYERFRLDEPWDSERNKKLIPLMPDIYRAPGSTAAAKFKTNYLTVRGPNTIFPGKQNVNIAQVRDGLSNTVMLVEVADQHAVTWTQPEDFRFDPKNAKAKWRGLRNGAVLVAMADSSSRTIAENLDPKLLSALFTRDGGETVSMDQIPSRSNRGNRQTEAESESTRNAIDAAPDR